MKKYNDDGFTLVEVIIAVAIVGVLVSMAMPSFSKMLERNRLKAAVESLKSDMQVARAEAIKRSQDIIVTRKVGNDGAWCYGYNVDDPDGNGIDDPCDCLQTATTAIDFCALKIISGNNFVQTNLLSPVVKTTFSFRRGTANASKTCFSTANYKIKVKVSSGGRVTLCTHSDTTAVPGVEACTSDNC